MSKDFRFGTNFINKKIESKMQGGPKEQIIRYVKECVLRLIGYPDFSGTGSTVPNLVRNRFPVPVPVPHCST